MRTPILISFFLLAMSTAFAQGVAINENGNAANPSAMLDVSSTDKGILVPRMTEADRIAINNPANGLLVYQTDQLQGFYYYNGTSWSALQGQLERITENFSTGFRIYGRDPDNYGVIGEDAVDLSLSNINSTSHGATGNWSFTTGRNTTASNNWSVAMGASTNASGSAATAMGSNSIASGNTATAIGVDVEASGIISVAMGNNTLASGRISTAMGERTTAFSGYEFVIGRWNTDYTPNSTTGWNTNDRLFVIGNGTSISNRKDALVMLKNGNTGMGTSNPSALLHTYGTGSGEGNILFEGEQKGTPGAPPKENAGTRMMWYPDKAAFRAGRVNGAQWNQANIGNHSAAFGENTTASGSRAMAWGNNGQASATNATTWGSSTTASNTNATAFGSNSEATGSGATAWGLNSSASNQTSTAWGQNTNASGVTSTAWGLSSIAGGTYSTASGEGSNAPSRVETAIGRYNTLYTPAGGSNTWNTSDRLLVVGNGVNNSNRSDAMVILKNGNTGLGASTPAALLHTNGTGTGEGNVVFVGQRKFANWGSPPIEGAGTRMMWYPDKAAFRAGTTNDQWNQDNIGEGSVAFGIDNMASGESSAAFGSFVNANGNYTLAGGLLSNANGTTGIAWGYFAETSGVSSMALGQGVSSTALAQTTLGSYNILYTGAPSTWNPIDLLFVIGNGTDDNNRSNAVSVLKNGRVGLQSSNFPLYALELPNNSSNGVGKGRAFEWTTYSDRRLKTDIAEVSYGLKEILQLQPLRYFHHNSTSDYERITIDNSGSQNIGFIAQDVFEIIPEVVSVPEDEMIGLWSMSYERLVPVLVKAIQEQQAMIEELRDMVNSMKE